MSNSVIYLISAVLPKAFCYLLPPLYSIPLVDLLTVFNTKMFTAILLPSPYKLNKRNMFVKSLSIQRAYLNCLLCFVSDDSYLYLPLMTQCGPIVTPPSLPHQRLSMIIFHRQKLPHYQLQSPNKAKNIPDIDEIAHVDIEPNRTSTIPRLLPCPTPSLRSPRALSSSCLMR